MTGQGIQKKTHLGKEMKYSGGLTTTQQCSDLQNRADQGKKFVNSVNEVINMDWVSNKYVQNFIFIIEKDFFLNSSFI